MGVDKIMTIRPPEELKEKLNSTAKEQGITLNQLVLSILRGWAERNKKTNN